MDSQIDIIINTMKKGVGDKDTKAALKDIGKQFQSVTGLSLGYAGAISASVAITKKLIDVTKDSINVSVARANATEKMITLTGDSAEVTSRFAEVSDDAKLSQEALEKALEAATKKGIDVSADSMARLSDEYLSLAPGLERAQFLTDKFGKSGAEMYKVMQLSGSVIRERMAAVSDSMVVDREAILLSNEYQKSLDDLNDSMTGVKQKIAKEATPAVTDFNKVLSFLIDKTTSSDNSTTKLLVAVEGLVLGLGPLIAIYKAVTKGLDLAADGIDKEKEGLDELSPAQKANGANLQAQADAYWANINAMDEYNTNLDEENQLSSVKAGLSGDLKRAQEEYITTLSNLNGTEDENIAAQKEAEEQVRKTTAQFIYQKVSAALDADASLQLARSMGLISEQDYNVSMATLDVISKFDLDRNGKIEGTEANNDFYASMQSIYDKQLALLGLEDKTFTYKFISYYETYGNPGTNWSDGNTPDGGSGGGGGGWEYAYTDANGKKWYKRLDADGTYSYEARAGGGSVHPGMGYMVGEKGPEPFFPTQDGMILPHDSLVTMQDIQNVSNGGGDTIFTGPISISVSGSGDPDAVADKIMRKIKLQQGGRS